MTPKLTLHRAYVRSHRRRYRSDLATVARSTVLESDAEERDLMCWSHQRTFEHPVVDCVERRARLVPCGETPERDTAVVRKNGHPKLGS